jgi:GT2 family glycosyltransferase
MHLITIVIPTRNRGDSVSRPVRTILQNDYAGWELRVVDQSDDGLTERALQPFLEDHRIRYRRTRTVGVATARNLGVAEARSEIVAMTDDDCEVPRDWLRELAAAFARDARIGIVFGNVLPGPHERREGFVPAYVRREPTLARGIRHKNRVEGTGACMGLRRSLWQALGGFDETLGAGARLRSSEETDLTIRALLAGFFVYETPRVQVTHHGLYPRERLRAAMQTYWYGTGAAFARSFAAHPAAIATVLLGLAGRWAAGRSRVAASLDERPHRLVRLAAFARGFAAGLAVPRRPAPPSPDPAAAR